MLGPCFQIVRGDIVIYLQEEVNNGPVAGIRNGFHSDALSCTLLLFPLEHVLIEVMLQLLIGDIDTHLRVCVCVCVCVTRRTST